MERLALEGVVLGDGQHHTIAAAALAEELDKVAIVVGQALDDSAYLRVQHARLLGMPRRISRERGLAASSRLLVEYVVQVTMSCAAVSRET
jgi:hypothetical protein